MLSPSVGNLSADFRIESWLARDIGNDPSTILYRRSVNSGSVGTNILDTDEGSNGALLTVYNRP